MNATPIEMVDAEDAGRAILMALAIGLAVGAAVALLTDRKPVPVNCSPPCDCAIDAQQRIDSLEDRLAVAERAPQPKRRRRSRS